MAYLSPHTARYIRYLDYRHARGPLGVPHTQAQFQEALARETGQIAVPTQPVPGTSYITVPNEELCPHCPNVKWLSVEEFSRGADYIHFWSLRHIIERDALHMRIRLIEKGAIVSGATLYGATATTLRERPLAHRS